MDRISSLGSLGAHLIGWATAIHRVIHQSILRGNRSVVHEWILLVLLIWAVSINARVHIRKLLAILWNDASSNYSKSTRILALSGVWEIAWLLNGVELVLISFYGASILVVNRHVHELAALILHLRTILLNDAAWISRHVGVLAESWPELTLSLILRLDTTLLESLLIVNI